MANNLIGLDVGGTKTALIVGDDEGRVMQRHQFLTDPAGGFTGWLAQLEKLYQVMPEVDSPQAISVSIGGPLDIERGIIYSPPNLPGWDAIPLKETLQKRFGLPVFVEHDGNAGAIAEWRFGAGRGTRNMIFLTMGTGLGAGFILDKHVYRGSTDLAGEVGHMRIAEDGPKAYGKRGSWEGYCAGPAFARLAQQMYPQRWPQLPTTPEIAALALAGDEQALQVVERVGTYLGRGLAVLADLINPESIVIGSMAVRLGDLVLEPARQELAREALPAAAKACRVVPAALGERIGDVASLCAAIEALHGERVESDD